MHKLFELLRLRYEANLSQRAIGRCLRLSHTSVGQYIRRFEEAGLSWPLDDVSETELTRLLFPPQELPSGERPLPNWGLVAKDLRRKGVTLRLLWFEYKERYPTGFQYTWFCGRYNAWARTCDLVMRQVHRAGEKLFVDYAGHTIPVQDPDTGAIFQAQIFVASLGASSYTYVEATRTQDLSDWIGAHVRALEFYGGSAELLIPDNLRSGVTKPHRYEPEVNRSYQEMANHYGVAVMPARVRAPRDKAVVESNVGLIERWILARLRNETFLSLASLNARIAELVTWVNNRPFKKLPGSRRSLFEELDEPALRPLPAAAYTYGDWKYARVPRDYHIAVDYHYYSVPHPLVGKQIEVRFTQHVVECFHRGRRIASHARSFVTRGTTTVNAHRPEAHQVFAGWDKERMTRFAEERGGALQQVFERFLANGPHLEIVLRKALAVARLEQRFEPARLMRACERALAVGACSFKSIESILETGLDRAPIPGPAQPEKPLTSSHNNLRGSTYYA